MSLLSRLDKILYNIVHRSDELRVARGRSMYTGTEDAHNT